MGHQEARIGRKMDDKSYQAEYSKWIGVEKGENFNAKDYEIAWVDQSLTRKSLI
jgi:hypothetical protein